MPKKRFELCKKKGHIGLEVRLQKDRRVLLRFLKLEHIGSIHLGPLTGIYENCRYRLRMHCPVCDRVWFEPRIVEEFIKFADLNSQGVKGLPVVHEWYLDEKSEQKG